MMVMNVSMTKHNISSDGFRNRKFVKVLTVNHPKQIELALKGQLMLNQPKVK
jgi:hypothetical protein